MVYMPRSGANTASASLFAFPQLPVPRLDGGKETSRIYSSYCASRSPMQVMYRKVEEALRMAIKQQQVASGTLVG
jgi:hypothetical protein